MDVLDIGDNRIDVMESLTDIVQFRGLISLRVEGNPVCREDAAIVQTLVNEMQGLLVIDGIETSVYSGGRKVMEEETPRSVLREVEMLESKRRRKEQKRLDGLAGAKQGSGSGSGSGSKRPSPPPIKRASSSSPGSLTRSTRTSPSSTRTSPSSRKTSPSSTSKTSPKTSRLRSSKSSQGSFTLSLASVMSDFDISDDAANGDRKTKKQFSSSSSSSSTTSTTTTTSSVSNQRPSIVPHLHVTKSSQIGSDYGLSRPMSARGVGSRNRSSGMASPRLSARGRRSEENAPVARASSMRTGRGTGLKVRNVLNSSFFCFEFI